MVGRNRWMFGLLIALATQGAWAQGGRINFAGAVVEPTCTISTAQLASLAITTAPVHRSCGQGAVDAGRSYSRTVTILDTAAVANNQLLGYFASYAPQESAGKPVPDLIVRTYD
ncbi:MAG: hypothetical protein RSP_28610 [Rhodanobacter sp.]